MSKFKPGYRTTEFYLTLAANAFMAYISTMHPAEAMLGMGILNGAYSYGRGAAKQAK